MTAVVSFTNNPLYSFFAPIVNYAWNKIGAECHFIIPSDYKSVENKNIWDLIFSKIPSVFVTSITADSLKMPTYSQVARLYLASEVDDEEILITSDADMIPFNADYFNKFADGRIHVVGYDLCPKGQYPMCFCAMPAQKWKQTMKMGDLDIQQMLDIEVGSLKSSSFRGDFWSRDQWLLYNNLQGHNVVFHARAREGTQFATHRYDRDDSFLLDRLSLDNIDFHCPRPGYEDKNIEIIVTVLKFHYPNDDFQWIFDYAKEYKNLL